MKDDEEEDWYKLLHPKAKGKIWYDKNVLATPEWQSITSQYKRKNPICQICGDERSTESHHTTYKMGLFNKGILLALCHKCHTNLHHEEEIKRLLAERRKK